MEHPLEQPIEHPIEAPLDPLVADIVYAFTRSLREEFEERAAIIEFDGQQQRAHAECLALIDILRRHPTLLTGVTFLQFEQDGTTKWLLTTDLDRARKHLTDIGGTEIGAEFDTFNLAAVINEQFSGSTVLAAIR